MSVFCVITTVHAVFYIAKWVFFYIASLYYIFF